VVMAPQGSQLITLTGKRIGQVKRKGAALIEMKKIIKSESGFAFLLTLFLILFVSLLFVAIFNLLITDLQITSNQKQDTEALYISEAGIEYAISNLRQDRDWVADSEETAFPAGSGNKYIVTYPVNVGILRSIAELSDGYTKTIETEVSISGNIPPFTITIIDWEEK